MVKKYKGKPVTAIQFFEDNKNECLEFVRSLYTLADIAYNSNGEKKLRIQIVIDADAGTQVATVGDYIVKDAHGMFLTYKPDFFHRIYEEVE